MTSLFAFAELFLHGKRGCGPEACSVDSVHELGVWSMVDYHWIAIQWLTRGWVAHLQTRRCIGAARCVLAGGDRQRVTH